MNIPKFIKTDINFIDEDGSPRNDVAIYLTHLVCHPDKLTFILQMFKDTMWVDLEIID